MIDVHGHVKGEHARYASERPIPYTPKAILEWLCDAAEIPEARGIAVTDHLNLVTPLDVAALESARRCIALATDGDIAEAARSSGVSPQRIAMLSNALRSGFGWTFGVEADNDPRVVETMVAALDACRPEFVLRSVHFLEFDHPKTGTLWEWPFDNPEFSYLFGYYGSRATWQRYVQTLIGELETKVADVVAHFYVPAKFGAWPEPKALEEYEDLLIDACAKRSIAIEFNTRVLYRNSSAHRDAYLIAYRRLIEKAARASVPLALGSDAHASNDQFSQFDAAKNLVASVRGVELYMPRLRPTECV